MCKSGTCPDGVTHYVKHPGRNRMECDLLNVEITQLPHNDCPVLVRQRKEDSARSTTTPETAEQLPDAKQGLMEQQQASVTTTTDPEPLTLDDDDALAARFVAECLSPKHKEFLDYLIGNDFS